MNVREKKIDLHNKLLQSQLVKLEEQLKVDEHNRDLIDKIERIKIELLPNDKKYFSEYLYTDVHAYEVIEQRTPDMYIVRRLHAELTDESSNALRESFEPGGFFGHFNNGCQEWTFTSDENNPLITIRRHKNGCFYAPKKRYCPFIMHDEPYEFYDYNF